MKSISILGCTGSIGRQTLAVVEALTGQFRVVGLAGGANLGELGGQFGRTRRDVGWRVRAFAPPVGFIWGAGGCWGGNLWRRRAFGCRGPWRWWGLNSRTSD